MSNVRLSLSNHEVVILSVIYMSRPECPYFRREGSVGPEKMLCYEPQVEINGKNLPIYGERKDWSPRHSCSTARFSVGCGR